MHNHHVLLGNDPDLGSARCRFFGASLYYGTAGGGGLVAPPSTQMYCAMTDGHCMLCLRHDTRPKPRGKKSMTGGGGAINRAAFPAASLSPRHWFKVR